MWIGWQEGMVGTAVQAAKRELRRKFSYASSLDDTPVFTAELSAVLREYQRRRNAAGASPALRTDGILDWTTQRSLGIAAPAPAGRKTVVFTVCGTGVGWDFGYPFDVGAAQDPARAVHQPIGYPAAVFPMGPSVLEGEAELVRQMRMHLDPHPDWGFVLVGYSQGAIVTSRALRRMVSGDLSGYYDRCLAGVTFGNPMREAGHCVGPDPGGHGLDPQCLAGTPDWWHDHAIRGDIYTCGDGGKSPAAMEYMTAVYSAVQGHLMAGSDSLAEQLVELFSHPVREASPVVAAIGSGWGFVTADPPTAPHIEYHAREVSAGVTHLDHAVDYVRRVVAAGRRL